MGSPVGMAVGTAAEQHGGGSGDCVEAGEEEDVQVVAKVSFLSRPARPQGSKAGCNPKLLHPPSPNLNPSPLQNPQCRRMCPAPMPLRLPRPHVLFLLRRRIRRCTAISVSMGSIHRNVGSCRACEWSQGLFFF